MKLIILKRVSTIIAYHCHYIQVKTPGPFFLFRFVLIYVRIKYARCIWVRTKHQNDEKLLYFYSHAMLTDSPLLYFNLYMYTVHIFMFLFLVCLCCIWTLYIYLQKQVLASPLKLCFHIFCGSWTWVYFPFPSSPFINFRIWFIY